MLDHRASRDRRDHKARLGSADPPGRPGREAPRDRTADPDRRATAANRSGPRVSDCTSSSTS